MESLYSYIEQLKAYLENLIIEHNGNLLDPEVIKVSQYLDIFITKFQQLSLKYCD